MKTTLLLVAVCAVAVAQDRAALLPNARHQTEPMAGTWKPWVISSGSQFRLPPPDIRDTRVELAWVKEFISQRDQAAMNQIRYWDAGAPLYRWQEIAFAEAISRYNGNNILVGRAVGLVNIAVYDATVAAWDSKYTYNRPRPKAVDPRLATALADPPSPSYPSEHAMTAGASATVLSYWFPDKRDKWAALADDAGRSRLLAGVQYPSDVTRGLELGRTVADQVVLRARSDGSDVAWTGTVPVGPGLWTGSNPALPMTGTWKTWVLTSGSQLRPAPPPAYDSAQKLAELAEVRNVPRTFSTNAT